jgi:hypothetical protein
MNLSEVTKLLDAGFTAEEIRGMMNNVPANNPQIPQVSPQVVGTDEQKQPDPVPGNNDSVPGSDHPSDPVSVPGQQTDQDDSKFTALNDTMQQLIRTIQSANLANSSFDKPTGEDLVSKVDRIMASIIRPERKEGGNN